jgi:pyrimidine operon attenuation protein/uracil phosphoribosyltransferase
LTQRLRALLGLGNEIGLIDVSFYRDDYRARGLHARVKPSSIPFDVEGRPLILVDDVLYTGRTTRAAINELFDYGRPAQHTARGSGRSRPPPATDLRRLSAPGESISMPSQELILSADAGGRLQWSLAEHA